MHMHAARFSLLTATLEYYGQPLEFVSKTYFASALLAVDDLDVHSTPPGLLYCRYWGAAMALNQLLWSTESPAESLTLLEVG